MKTLVKYKPVWIIVMFVVSVLCSCEPEITRYLKAPATMKIEKVSGDRLDVRWEAIKEAEQYIVYKVFEYGPSYAQSKIKYYASQYEIARTSVPQYQYQGSYDPIENGYSSSYFCYFGVRVMDENGNMSDVILDDVPRN